MRPSIRIIISVLFILTAACVVTSQTLPRPQAVPGRSVGQAIVTYSSSQNETTASTYFYIQGTKVEIQSKKDGIMMLVGYRVPGPKSVAPKSLFTLLTAYSFSSEGSKYKNDHKLSIYVDNKKLFSSDTYVSFSSYRPNSALESFAVSGIKYSDFLKMLNAKKVIIQLGQTKSQLSTEAVQALKDLNDTIQHN